MKKQTLLCFALTAVVLFASAAFLPSNESEIYDQVVRLHILANSDSERDQALKLLVRDAVTARSEEIFGTYDAIDDVLALFEVLKAMDEERDDLGSYVNLFGYNPKYGVSGRRIVGVRYEPQSFSKGLTRPEQTLPARVARR